MTKKKQRKVRRKYFIKNKQMVVEIARLIRDTPQSEKNLRLDNYEREMIKFPSRWVKDAPLSEIMVLLTKLGHPVCFSINDERKPLKAYELHKATKEFHRTGNLDALMKMVKEHNYFCMTGAQIMKTQDQYSHLIGGTTFKLNPYPSLLLKSAANKELKNQKVMDEFVLNLLENSEIGELSFNDWKIIFLLRKYEEMPVSTMFIHGRLSLTVEPNVLQRHLTRLTKFKYLQKFGTKKLSTYILAPRAWQAITELKRKCYEGLRFWDNGLNLQILNENGSSSTTEKRREDSDTKGVNSTM